MGRVYKYYSLSIRFADGDVKRLREAGDKLVVQVQLQDEDEEPKFSTIQITSE